MSCMTILFINKCKSADQTLMMSSLRFYNLYVQSDCMFVVQTETAVTQMPSMSSVTTIPQWP